MSWIGGWFGGNEKRLRMDNDELDKKIPSAEKTAQNIKREIAIRQENAANTSNKVIHSIHSVFQYQDLVCDEMEFGLKEAEDYKQINGLYPPLAGGYANTGPWYRLNNEGRQEIAYSLFLLFLVNHIFCKAQELEQRKRKNNVQVAISFKNPKVIRDIVTWMWITNRYSSSRKENFLLVQLGTGKTFPKNQQYVSYYYVLSDTELKAAAESPKWRSKIKLHIQNMVAEGIKINNRSIALSKTLEHFDQKMEYLKLKTPNPEAYGIDIPKEQLKEVVKKIPLEPQEHKILDIDEELPVNTALQMEAQIIIDKQQDNEDLNNSNLSDDDIVMTATTEQFKQPIMPETPKPSVIEMIILNEENKVSTPITKTPVMLKTPIRRSEPSTPYKTPRQPTPKPMSPSPKITEELREQLEEMLQQEEVKQIEVNDEKVIITKRERPVELQNDMFNPKKYIKPDYPKAKDRTKGIELNQHDYLDYAFTGFCRESGTVLTDIMKIPSGFNSKAERLGNRLLVTAIHFRNVFSHRSGAKVTGRMIIFYSKYPMKTTIPVVNIATYKDVEPNEILEKSITQYIEDVEELDAPDLLYEPTILSDYNYNNVYQNDLYEIIYDYYADFNTQAVKSEVDSLEQIKTKWVKINDLELEFWYDQPNDKVASKGILGVLFMGDYFGGEVSANLTLRVYFDTDK